MIIVTWVVWWQVGLWYALWAWRLEFKRIDPCICLLAAGLTMIIGPLAGVVWHRLYYTDGDGSHDNRSN